MNRRERLLLIACLVALTTYGLVLVVAYVVHHWKMEQFLAQVQGQWVLCSNGPVLPSGEVFESNIHGVVIDVRGRYIYTQDKNGTHPWAEVEAADPYADPPQLDLIEYDFVNRPQDRTGSLHHHCIYQLCGGQWVISYGRFSKPPSVQVFGRTLWSYPPVTMAPGKPEEARERTTLRRP